MCTIDTLQLRLFKVIYYAIVVIIIHSLYPVFQFYRFVWTYGYNLPTLPTGSYYWGWRIPAHTQHPSPRSLRPWAWTWLSWSAWTVLLTGLFMYQLEQTIHKRTDLNNVFETVMINQQPYMFIIHDRINILSHITRLNNDVTTTMNLHGCCIKSGFACSNIHEQPLSIRQAVYNMFKHDWTILLFYQSCYACHVNSVVTGLLSQQPCNHSIWYFYACSVIHIFMQCECK